MSSTGWQHMESSFEGARGTQIYYQAWTPTGRPTATLVMIHGQGDHCGRYAHVAEYMARRNYSIWAQDLRGHGKSGGKRGHVDSFDDYLVDTDRLIRIGKEHDRSSTTILLGHSLGGLLATRFAEERGSELAGLIATAPLFALKMKLPAWKKFIGRTLSSIIPTLTLRTGLDANLLSHDRKIVRDYTGDPLVHGVASARFYTEFLRGADETVNGADQLTLPCLIMHGGADGIVDSSATVGFFKKIASSDKTLKVYDGFYHEILNEPGKESVLGDISTWLSARI
ncbi:alpha/beta hydrolase [Candidatus Bathyarchaeota archaeon]|nr:alpha/beta hydrolase [Candidatus Bathyarchaeota archaeon]